MTELIFVLIEFYCILELEFKLCKLWLRNDPLKCLYFMRILCVKSMSMNFKWYIDLSMKHENCVEDPWADVSIGNCVKDLWAGVSIGDCAVEDLWAGVPFGTVLWRPLGLRSLCHNIVVIKTCGHAFPTAQYCIVYMSIALFYDIWDVFMIICSSFLLRLTYILELRSCTYMAELLF
jgi:hypothetical protein